MNTIDITDPTYPINITPLSESEARQLTEEIKENLNGLNDKLLEAYRRKAWEVLGYNNFVDYAQVEFEKSKTDAYRLLDAARVTNSLFPEFGKQATKIPVSQREVLLKLPSEQRSQALKEAIQLAEDEGKSAPTADHLRRIVCQKLNLSPKAEKPSKKGNQNQNLWHSPKWVGHQAFELEDPALWIEYFDLGDVGCCFNFYEEEGVELVKCVAVGLESVCDWNSPQAAAPYLARKHLSRWLIARQIGEGASSEQEIVADWERKTAELSQAQEEINCLQARLEESDRLTQALQKEVLDLVTQLNQSRPGLGVGSEVGKRFEGWRGTIREMNGTTVKVHWQGHYTKGRGGKKEETLSTCHAADLCLFPADLVEDKYNNAR